MINPDDLKFGDKINYPYENPITKLIYIDHEESGYIRCINEIGIIDYYNCDEIDLGWGEE